jgi:hypothetical protein
LTKETFTGAASAAGATGSGVAAGGSGVAVGSTGAVVAVGSAGGGAAVGSSALPQALRPKTRTLVSSSAENRCQHVLWVAIHILLLNHGERKIEKPNPGKWLQSVALFTPLYQESIFYHMPRQYEAIVPTLREL